MVVNADDIYEAFHEIRYPLIEDENGDYVLEYFAGEKLGDCKKIFNSFAKFIEPNSFIEFEGEDGSVLKYTFDGNECKSEWS